jgi:hypothetical protein
VDFECYIINYCQWKDLVGESYCVSGGNAFHFRSLGWKMLSFLICLISNFQKMFMQCLWSLSILRGCVLILPKDWIRNFLSVIGSFGFFLFQTLFRHFNSFFILEFGTNVFHYLLVWWWGLWKFLLNLQKPSKSLLLTMSLVLTL